MIRPIAAATCLALSATGAQAADPSGRFAVEGVGAAPCIDFSQAMNDREGQRFAVYGGWVMGYVTALNRQTEGIFDYTPWQPAEVLMFQLGRYCVANPNNPVERGMAELIAFLRPGAMAEADELVTFETDGRASMIYAHLLPKLSSALIAKGYENDGSQASLAQAISAFQKDQSLPETGLPDTNVLARLIGGS